jgi:hypothetical protein
VNDNFAPCVISHWYHAHCGCGYTTALRKNCFQPKGPALITQLRVLIVWICGEIKKDMCCQVVTNRGVHVSEGAQQNECVIHCSLCSQVYVYHYMNITVFISTVNQVPFPAPPCMTLRIWKPLKNNNMKRKIFWCVTPCTVVELCQCVRGICCLHLQGRRVSQTSRTLLRAVQWLAGYLPGFVLTLKMETSGSCKYQCTLFPYTVSHPKG